MGLSSDALFSWFLHRHLPIFCTVSNSCRLSGLGHLDYFIVTAKSCPSTGIVQKHMPTPTQTATTHTTEPLGCMLAESSYYAFTYLESLSFLLYLDSFFARFIVTFRFLHLPGFSRLPNPAWRDCLTHLSGLWIARNLTSSCQSYTWLIRFVSSGLL